MNRFKIEEDTVTNSFHIVGDFDKRLMLLNPRQFTEDVRATLVGKVADLIMESLEPAIKQALAAQPQKESE